MPTGLHHITAIARDPAKNRAFYEGVLGLRLVKKTVNFDDPGTYHLYYGDEVGSPGTLLTFFPYPEARPGRHGIGQAVEIAFAVPEAALSFWMGRLDDHGVAYRGPDKRFGQTLIRFEDPDGLKLEIIAVSGGETRTKPWSADGIPTDMAIRGFHSVTLWEEAPDATAAVLTGVLGFEAAGKEDQRVRFIAKDAGGIGTIVDIAHSDSIPTGIMGAGTNHHVAFRAADDDHERKMSAELSQAGLNTTPIIDRTYFHSVYFREPGGVLFEIATDGPGFAIDEPAESLGQTLQLPERYEARRAEIEGSLPPL